MNVFIKRLNSHELGYRNGIPGGAGAFWLISKKCTNFLPSLSKSILNDHTLLEVQTPLNITASVRYEYHNSKFASNDPNETRDEYRLYMNQDINPNGNYFEPGDIVILKKEDTNSYNLHLFDRNNQYNSVLNKLITQYKSGNASAALVPITSLETLGITLDIHQINECNYISNQLAENHEVQQNISTLINDEDLDALFSEPIFDQTTSTTISVNRINRDSSFRKGVLKYYNNQCSITRLGLTYGNLSNIEAAHIIPKQSGGGDNISNGIALSRDLHWAFDAGFFTITQDYKILVHHKVSNTNDLWRSINGQTIFIPIDDRAKPNTDALKWHNENVYGAFINR
ncbi:HNH endonuclease [Candidatus Clostridium stratigraminis]|uniref:HNH endonuclease n=1 Tax=Candidatus Clostridium stratigraminis TaxID=3381661 RepID=A0ABW8T1D6_9CLOT